MRKLFSILILLISISILTACASKTPEYLAKMTKLETVEAVDVWDSFSKTTYYVSHKMVLNPEETLYYAPKKFQDGENIYLNDKEMFFILSVKPGVFTTTRFREATADELKLIFE
jgi:predicted small lipoprotein YifL